MPSDFTPPSEELLRLAEEISLLRRDFQVGMAALGRIEKRLKATFPTYAPKKQTRQPSSSDTRRHSTKSRDDLMTDFDSLISATKERGDVGFESFLSTLPEQDVIAMAYELGVGSPKTTSTKKAREGIRENRSSSALKTRKTLDNPTQLTCSPRPRIASYLSGWSGPQKMRLDETRCSSPIARPPD
jgi:hypothetical protein